MAKVRLDSTVRTILFNVGYGLDPTVEICRQLVVVSGEVEEACRVVVETETVAVFSEDKRDLR